MIHFHRANVDYFIFFFNFLSMTTKNNKPKTIIIHSDSFSARQQHSIYAIQCQINHVADVANATGLRPQDGLRK